MHPKLFIGRQAELARLSELSRKKTASLAVIRGRRRIGKSRLIEQFAVDKCLLKFSGLAPDKTTTAEDQRQHFARQLIQQCHVAMPNTADWDNLFLYLAQHLPKSTKPLVVLLDEISWMAHKDATFLAKLKDAWDLHFSKHPNLILVLCGSVSSWIDKNILSHTGFLGRIHETITLTELNLVESLQLLAAVGFQGSDFEKLLVLSITGGVPWYLEQFTGGKSAFYHIQRLCFAPEGLLVLEFKKIFHDLFARRARSYVKIVQALLSQAKEYKALALASGYPSSGVFSRYLEELTLSGFISKDTLWSFKTGQDSSIAVYRLKDNYLRFYLKYIAPNRSRIDSGHWQNQSVLDLKGFYSIMGLQFENLVLNNKIYIYEALGLVRSTIVADNPYWQTPTKQRAGCQIDLLIQTQLNTLYVCEIKWSQKEIGASVVDDVKEKIRLLNIPKGFACVPVLIYFGELTGDLLDNSYFYQLIDFKSIMKG